MTLGYLGLEFYSWKNSLTLLFLLFLPQTNYFPQIHSFSRAIGQILEPLKEKVWGEGK
jgi:hypothetical protein